MAKLVTRGKTHKVRGVPGKKIVKKAAKKAPAKKAPFPAPQAVPHVHHAAPHAAPHAALLELLSQCQRAVTELSDQLGGRYFSHADRVNRSIVT